MNPNAQSDAKKAEFEWMAETEKSTQMSNIHAHYAPSILLNDKRLRYTLKGQKIHNDMTDIGRTPIYAG
jgi:hypothetical protein